MTDSKLPTADLLMLGNYCILLLWKEFNLMKRTDEVAPRESHMEIALSTRWCRSKIMNFDNVQMYLNIGEVAMMSWDDVEVGQNCSFN